MICTQCGRPVDPGSVFCTNCGARVEQAPSMAGPVRAARSRPLGLVVVIILTALGGLVILSIALLLWSSMGLAEAIAAYSMGFGMRGERVPFWGPLLLTLILLGGVFFLAAAYGLAAFERWALSLSRTLYALLIPLTIVGAIAGPRGAAYVVGALVGIALDVWVLMYLSTPEIRASYS